ncbi:MAG: hypothetical protein WC783_04470, partial [Candidatus Paceibacterota bacterium]
LKNYIINRCKKENIPINKASEIAGSIKHYLVRKSILDVYQKTINEDIDRELKSYLRDIFELIRSGDFSYYDDEDDY